MGGRVHRPPIEYTFSSELSTMLEKLGIFLIAVAIVKLIIAAAVHYRRKKGE